MAEERRRENQLITVAPIDLNPARLTPTAMIRNIT
jgi:hypothetical protein